MRKNMRVFFAAVLMMVMLLSACSGGKETTAAPTTEAPTTAAPTTAVPTTAAPSTEASTSVATTTQEPKTEAPTEKATESGGVKELSHDFDPATNRKVVAYGYEFQIPARWNSADPNYYPSTERDKYGMVQYSFVDQINSAIMRTPAFLDNFVKGLTNSFLDAEVISAEMVELLGKDASDITIQGTMGDGVMSVRFVSLVTPDDSGLFTLSFGNYTDIVIDYSEDYQKILDSLKESDEPQTQKPTEESSEGNPMSEKPAANDFDPETNASFTAYGFEFQVPAKWAVSEPYFYPDLDYDNFAMLYYYANQNVSEDMLENPAFAESFSKGLLNNVTGDKKLLQSEIIEINGRKMIRSLIRGEISGIEMVVDFATMYCPEVNGLFGMAMGQNVNAEVDYTNDFEKILGSLKDVKN